MAIQNLIDNAIKYSDRRSPVIVRAYKEHLRVHLVVEDFGIGISDEEKSAIFERIYRGRANDTLEPRGFGLGLSFVQSIVTAMSGTISVEDNHPCGTRFIITLDALAI
ncbi:MAG: sensor histidine kinase [candidate division KSB1 bacterium]|nr:sensor histidine kinase [candidate division KSB1 bacterium]